MKIKVVILSLLAIALIGAGQLRINGEPEIIRGEIQTAQISPEAVEAVFKLEEPEIEPQEPSEPAYESMLAIITPEPQEEAQAAETANEGGWQYFGVCTITHYCPCSICNGKWTGTASGAPLTPYRTAACGVLPFGTEVMVNGQIYVVEDTGVNGMWIDLCVSSHDEALQRGMYHSEVWIR